MNGVDASSSKLFDQLPPVLRTLLLSDGTVTKFLEAYYQEPIRVKTLFHAEAPPGEDMTPLAPRKGDRADRVAPGMSVDTVGWLSPEIAAANRTTSTAHRKPAFRGAPIADL